MIFLLELGKGGGDEGRGSGAGDEDGGLGELLEARAEGIGGLGFIEGFETDGFGTDGGSVETPDAGADPRIGGKGGAEGVDEGLGGLGVGGAIGTVGAEVEDDDEVVGAGEGFLPIDEATVPVEFGGDQVVAIGLELERAELMIGEGNAKACKGDPEGKEDGKGA